MFILRSNPFYSEPSKPDMYMCLVKKNVNDYYFVNFILQFMSVHVVAGNIRNYFY